MTRVYEEIVDFIAAGTTPAGVASFRASDEARQRVFELLEKQRANSISPEEEDELAHYLQIEHIVRLAKARAHQHQP